MTHTRHDGYERLLEDFGRQLKHATTARSDGRRRPLRDAAGALVLAGIVAGTLMLASAGVGGHLDVVAQAKAALAPAGRIVHLVTTSHMEMRDGAHAEIVGPEAEGNTPRVTERWSTSQPLRWRAASTVPIVTLHGTSAGPVQQSYDGGTEEVYVQSLNTLEIRTGVSADSPRASLDDGPLGADPVAGIRSMLEAGRLRDAGSATVDGRPVLRLVGEELNPPLRAPHRPWPVEYDVNPQTYAPARFIVEEVGLSYRGNTGTPTQVVDVNTYEQLPLNEATAVLLSIHPVGSPTTIIHSDRKREALTR
jgi:hypothetical protein